jgi:BirA family biotin operon repressor/biotin-[acetyl-CoA-carboxylase] ligase
LETAIKILKKLLPGRRSVSGQVLADSLKISRTAVWKGISKLRELGYGIEAFPGSGYRIISQPENLSVEMITANLSTRYLGKKVLYYPEIDSTNRLAKEAASDGADEGTLVITDYQTKGRGRLDRSWESESGQNLMFSFILRPRIPLFDSFLLTMAAGISMAEAIETETGLPAMVKWPNDIFLNGKKLAGILTEISGQSQALDWAVIGIGVNINSKPDLDTAMYLNEQTDEAIDRINILNRFLINFEAVYRNGRPSEDIIERWRAKSYTLGLQVEIDDNGEIIKGLAEDIDKSGALMVRTNEGKIKVICGDVTVIDG